MSNVRSGDREENEAGAKSTDVHCSSLRVSGGVTVKIQHLPRQAFYELQLFSFGRLGTWEGHLKRKGYMFKETQQFCVVTE